MLSFGLMSGTSMDAIDVACLETDGEDYIVELGHAKLDYSAETKWLLKAAERAIKAAEGDLRAAALHYPNMLQEYLTQELKIEQKAAAKELARLTTYLQAENKTDNPLSLEAVIQLSTRLHAQVVKKLLLQIGKQPQEIDVIGYHGQTMFHTPCSVNLSLYFKQKAKKYFRGSLLKNSDTEPLSAAATSNSEKSK